MSLALDSLLSGYTSTYRKNIYRGVDRNSDGTYSRKEIGRFADAYETSTGTALDVDALFARYDTDADGALSGAEYGAAEADDALGMDRLFGAAEAEEQSAAAGESFDVEAALSSLRGAERSAFVRATWKAESTSSLLSAMFGPEGMASSLRYAASQYKNTMLINSRGYQNSLLSAVNILL